MASKRIYISGPMTGMSSHNFFAFHAAADRLRKAGWAVVNPAENFEGRTDLPREAYMRVDVSLMATCNAIAMLPMWRQSRGARVEYLLAREMGMELLDAQTLQPLADAPAAAVMLAVPAGKPQAAESVLDEAKRITGGERRQDYGHPADDFAHTALMWNGILAAKLRAGAFITAMDVPLCMIAVKLARQSNRHKRDNLVDIAGYARTAAMVAGDE
jgi:hypothetical protein